MKKINVLIVEDSEEDSLLLSEILTANNYNVVTASGYEQALRCFYNQAVDILVLDIFIDGYPEGINLAQTINMNPETAKPFVFLTNSSDRRIFEKAKITKPFSYLLKPFNELEILYALEIAVEKFYTKDQESSTQQVPILAGDSVFIKKGKSLGKVLFEDIVYIEVEERYCNIVTTTEKFVIQISLTKIMPLLDSHKFVRTHRNYIANSNKILEIILSENTIIMEGNHVITLGNKYKDFLNTYTIL
ncbi:response regulator transcription factor [Chryseobacterium sp. JJR-5R]|uniref:LytR/AlgR family response regulator transcription factor n=1 Tax=Chryseobacterium sp. JJR-5R TaxID=3093923 RepID=UPI002A76633E|nr:response regulator transcription factor [Chryseobacterium sp. JJR-5R]WPO81410.1 response regulator transcription factor [Chryseobacterium sp. JJR-5R]